MSDPIPERIAGVIVTRLEAITTTNGYAITVDDVIRPDRQARAYTPKNNLIIVEQADSVPVPELDHPGNPPAICEALTFQIYALNRPADKSETPAATNSNTLEACIKKAICSSSDWYHFSNLAIDAVFGTTQQLEGTNGDHVGVMIPLVVNYRYSETDPFEVRR